MIRKHKKYSRPRKPFEKKRIEEEAVIIEKYGLKSKREIWKAEAAVRIIRRRAQTLIRASQEEQKKFFERLQKKGFMASSIADVLALNKEDYLRRRLQTILVEKKLAPTMKTARQLIVHKHVRVGENIVNAPSYLVPIEIENQIKLKKMRAMAVPKEEGEKNE